MYYTSGCISGFAIKIESIQKINPEEAEGYIQLCLEEFKQKDGFDPKTPDNEMPEGCSESYRGDESILRTIFGLPHTTLEDNGSLLGPFWFICDLFGTELNTEVYEMPPIRDLKFKNSKLNGFYKTPFGFPPEDESIGFLTLDEIREERKQLEGSLDKTYEEVWDFTGMNPQQIEEEKELWNDLIFPARKTYLDWLDHCLQEETDLIIIET